MRFIPEIWRNYQEIREAQAARGLGAHPLALLVPLVVRTLKRAEEVAQAIDARG
ncbi:cobalt transport protein [Bordetella pertussis]|nr:cobalt transport protein [Bordetella pertussis]CPJ38082.1 cobalt transport protein [Bordetella pertussis]CPO65743.1 cobalt transport protein [Bordetella pertussis]CPQ52774.1 cobalt transport protein [Bordetella pertussis]